MQSNVQYLKYLVRMYTISSRTYYTKSKPKNNVSLYSKISPLGNPSVDVTPELEKWVESGKKIRFAELQRIILDLRKRKRFTQALQVSEWTKSSSNYTFSPAQHAVQLDLIGKVRGFMEAESYFNCLSEQDKTEKTYGALLHCYVRQNQTKRALEHLKKMKEEGVSLTSVAFNDIMCLYTDTGEIEKVPDVLNKMKEHNVRPDNLSYRICINSYGVRRDIEGLERILIEMENDVHITMDWNTYAVAANFYIKADLIYKANVALKKAEQRLDSKDGSSYNHLISLHSRMGNRDDVCRLWDLEKSACKRCLNRDYINMMESLVRLGELERAEKVFKEWESSGNCYDFRVPSVLISGHIDKGFCGKAEALLEFLMEKGKTVTSNIWAKLAVGYMEKGDFVVKSLESLQLAVSLNDANNSIKLEVKLQMLRLVGKNGSIDDARRVINMLKSVTPLTIEMYHELLEAYVGKGKEVQSLLDALKSDDCEVLEEAFKIISSKIDQM